MMRYSVFVKQEGQDDIFLQSSVDLHKVKKPRADLNRWLSEMGVEVSNHATAKFVLTQGGKPIFERYFLGAASKSWKPLEESVTS